MSRRKNDPLREITPEEHQALVQLSRSQGAPAVEVTRAKLLLAAARGDDYRTAAHSVGRRSGDAVSHLVARFNAEGRAALMPRHGGGRGTLYDPAAAGRILGEVERTPTPEADGTATWSLSTLRRVLRSAPDGLPTISIYTLWRVLHEAGYGYNARAPGAPPARPCAAARRERRSSPTPMRRPKKVDRGCLSTG